MVRLKDIAEITGFSITTVSRILNNDKTLRTSQNTKNIIKTVAEATGYKTLNEKKKERYKKKNSLSMVVGIIEMSSTNEVIKDPYYIYLKEFLEKVCRKNTIKSLSLTFDLKRQKYVNNDISKLKVNGLIAIGRFSKLEVKAMEKLSKNIVFLDTAYPNGEYSSIAPDLELGVKNGLDYLFEKGHRKIYFIGWTPRGSFVMSMIFLVICSLPSHIQSDKINLRIERDAEHHGLFVVFCADDSDGMRLVCVCHARHHRILDLFEAAAPLGRGVHHLFDIIGARLLAHVLAQRVVDLFIFALRQLRHDGKSRARDLVLVHAVGQLVSAAAGQDHQQHRSQCEKPHFFAHIYPFPKKIKPPSLHIGAKT